MRLIKGIRYFFFKEVDGIGLAAFRVFFFINLLAEIVFMYAHRHLYYDRIPYIEGIEIALSIPFLFWGLSLIALVVGFMTRIAAVVNYFMVMVFLTGLANFEYHMDYVYTGISFLAIFMPLGKVFSVDRWIKKWRNRNHETQFNLSRGVRSVYYYVPVLFGLAVVYTDSIFFKFISPMWLNGLGMWLPASMPPVTIWNDSFMLDNFYLMKFLGYLTLAFEILFIFLFWFKPFRVPFMIIGVGLHVGIFLEFPIPYFALGSVAIYALMVPIKWWKRIERGIRSMLARMKIGVGNQLEENAITESEKGVPKTANKLDELKFKMFAIGMAALILCQVNISLFSPFTYKATSKVLGVIPDPVRKSIESGHRNLSFISQKLFGITFHPVFMDGHFRDLRTLALVYESEKGPVFLPFVNEDGMPSEQIKGGAWVNWTFRIGRNGSESDEAKISEGIKRYTAYWIGVNGMEFKGTYKFTLMERVNEPVFEWEPGLLERNLAKPWIPFGEATWDGLEFNLELNGKKPADGSEEN